MSENRVALVTGGSRGIGLAIVKALRAQEIKVAVIGRGDCLKGCDHFIRADLSRFGNPHDVVQEVAHRYGRLDILINNAGAQYNQPADEYQAELWQTSLNLMVTAPFRLAQSAKLFMENGGHIVNILSTAAFQGARNIVGYVTAKHALLGLTRALAIEWAPDIHVNAVAPGLVSTDMTKDMTPERKAFLESITPSGRFCTSEEIADAVLFLVNSTGIYGQTITVDGGWMVKNG